MKNGAFKSADYKLGLQTHIHFIVSRKDKTQKMKLSPVANARSKERTIGNNKYHVGFDRTEWIKKMSKPLINYLNINVKKWKNLKS